MYCLKAVRERVPHVVRRIWEWANRPIPAFCITVVWDCFLVWQIRS